MKSTRLNVVIAGLMAIGAACSSSSGIPTGSGGTQGSGGAGGLTGTGGTTASPGSGGSGSGGHEGVGGVVGSGGRVGTGGAAGSGGAGSGGVVGSGGTFVMPGRDAGRDLAMGEDAAAPVNKDTGSSSSEAGSGSCGGVNQACCPYPDGTRGGTCDDGGNCTSDLAGKTYTCAACGGSGQPCCGQLGNWTCQKGMCNQSYPPHCP
jgi:hypothetical protein